MKINDVEKRLGITKANIRFYEKEGLLTPGRSENGYREYSEEDIARLKEIIIYRKLGIPVQQIEDILDGALPLQEAVDANIAALNEEIEQLNGSLALCRQLKSEDARTLDTERYWEIIQNQEQLGFQFQTLVDDYLKFTEISYEWLFWPLPIDALRSPWKVGTFILGFSAFYAGMNAMIDRSLSSFLEEFLKYAFSWIRSLIVWSAMFIPLFFLSKKHPKLANGLMIGIVVIAAVLSLGIVFWVIVSPLA